MKISKRLLRSISSSVTSFALLLAWLILNVGVNAAATFNFNAGNGYANSSNVALTRAQLGAGAYTISGDLTLNAGVATVNITLDQNLGGTGTLTKNGPGTLSIGQTGGMGISFGTGGDGRSGNGPGFGSSGYSAGGGGGCGTPKPAGYTGTDGTGGMIYVEFYDANNGIVGHFQANLGSGSLIVPALATKAKVWAAGGGGGAAGSPSGKTCGGGGGGGGVSYPVVNVTGGTTATFSVGGGGSGAYGNGGDGGNSSVVFTTASVSGNGGQGGTSGPNGSAGGPGGNCTVTGSIVTNGCANGGDGANGSNPAHYAGGGGAVGGADGSGSNGASPNVGALSNITAVMNRGANANSFNGDVIVNAGTARNISDNAIPDGSVITVANAAGATYNFNGFDDTVEGFSGGGATGGTITIPATSNISSNGASTYTFAGTLTGNGTFNKTGSGVQKFTANNTFNGSTNVSAGELQITANYASPITLTAGKLSGDLVSTSSLNANGTSSVVQPGIAAGTADVMKFSSVSLGTSTVSISTDTTIPASIVATGAVNLGTAKFNITGALPQGTYDLVTGSSISGTPTLGTNSTGHQAYLLKNGNKLQLVVDPQLIVTPGVTALTEGGTNGDLKIRLNAQPVGNVTVSVASNDTGAVTTSPTTLTFTTANWNTDQTVTLSPVSDFDIRNESVNITSSIVAASSSNEWDLVPSVVTPATVADDDTAGFSISKTTATIAENAGTTTFTTVLTAQPTTNVDVAISSSSTADATVSPATLTFTPANWNVPQTVTVTAVDDFIDRDDTATITASIVDTTSDDAWDPLADQTLALTLTDDDTAGITVSKTLASVTEQGATDSITVKLNSQPVSNVVILLNSPDVGAVTAAPSTLTFTPANWNVAQTVTFTGVDDADIVNESVIIPVSVDDPNSDNIYDPLADIPVTVTVVDNDTAGFALSTTALTVAENAGTGTFTVVLNSQPQSNVVISLTSVPTLNATVSPATMTFTPANWNVAQTATVTGVNDNVDTLVDKSATVTASVVDASSDDNWDVLADKTLSVTVTDDDTSTLIVSATTLTVGENGGTGTFTVKLSSQPLTNVVVSVNSSLVGEGTAAPATLTFTNANWNVAQTVTVTGVDDSIDTPTNSTSTITMSVVDASSYDTFDPAPDQTVVATFTDDDVASYTVSTNTLTIPENGGTATFNVKLNTQPQSNVVFDITSSSVADGTVSPATLTFTPANWNVNQAVTVIGVDDFVDSLTDDTSIIKVSVNDAASDNQFDPLADQTVNATFTDDDHVGITLSRIAVTLGENAGTGTFTVKLDA